MKLVIGAIFFIFLLGCTIPSGGNPDGTFVPEENFTITSGKTYTYNTNQLPVVTISDIVFTDSRCPVGVQCIWGGEQGVMFKLSLSIVQHEIILGKRTKTKHIVGGFEIELISIDAEKKEAVIKVTLNETNGRYWVYFDPKQCNSNPWDEGQWQVKRLFRDYEDRVRSYLGVQYGIETFDYATKQISDVVCEACSCSNGQRISVLIDSEDLSKIIQSGWSVIGKENEIACTLDAKICPDESAVGREAPFCEFAACPGGDELIPPGQKVFIKKTDVPGFVIDPVTVVTTIYGDGNVLIEKTEQKYSEKTENWDSTVTVKYGFISDQKLKELKDFTLNTNFFSIAEEDARTCIIDIPTQQLEITIENKHNIVSGIEAQCEEEKVDAAKKIIEEMNSSIQGIINAGYAG